MAQDDARPQLNNEYDERASISNEPHMEVMFRILSLSAFSDEELNTSKSTNNQETTTAGKEATPPKVAGVVPSPLEKTAPGGGKRLDFDSASASAKQYTNDGGAYSANSQKSKVASLIEQSSKAYLKNRIIDQIEDGKVTYTQRRIRDNIQVSLNTGVNLIDDN